MAKIPTYTSQASLRTVKLTTQAPAVKVNPSAFGIESQAIQGVGEVIAKIGENIYELQAQSELSKANTEWTRSRKNIEATNDDNPVGWIGRRDEEALKEKERILKNIKNPLAKREFQLQADRDYIDTQARLKNRYASLTVIDSIDSADKERAEVTDTIYNATSETEINKEIAKVKSRYDGLVLTKAMTDTQAAKEFSAWKKDLIVGKPRHDLKIMPEYVATELRKGKLGAYPDVPKDERFKIIAEADTKAEKLKAEEEERIVIARNQTEADQIDLRSRGILIEDIVKNNPFTTPEFKKAMIANLRSPKTVTAKTNFNVYSEVMEDILDPDKTATEIKKTILDYNSQGKLSEADMRSLLFVSKLGQDPIFQKSIEEQSPSFFKSVWNSIKSIFKFPADIATVANNVIKRAEGGIAPEELPQVTKEEIDKEVAKQNPNKVNYEIGDTVTNPETGKSYKVIGYEDDGEPTVEEIKE